MKDTLKKSLYLGVGAISLTKEKIEQLVDDLIHKGEASQSERAKLIDEFFSRAKEQEKEVTDKVKDIVKSYGVVSKKEFDELRKRLEKLEKKLSSMETSAKKTTSKKTTSKGAASNQ